MTSFSFTFTPDCAEYGQYTTGTEAKGITFAIQTFAVKLAAAISGSLGLALLGFFGFQGSFEGVHSLPELMNEWFEMLGPIGDMYENFINSVNTSELLAFLMGFLG